MLPPDVDVTIRPPHIIDLVVPHGSDLLHLDVEVLPERLVVDRRVINRWQDFLRGESLDQVKVGLLLLLSRLFAHVRVAGHSLVVFFAEAFLRLLLCILLRRCLFRLTPQPAFFLFRQNDLLLGLHGALSRWRCFAHRLLLLLLRLLLRRLIGRLLLLLILRLLRLLRFPFHYLLLYRFALIALLLILLIIVIILVIRVIILLRRLSPFAAFRPTRARSRLFLCLLCRGRCSLHNAVAVVAHPCEALLEDETRTGTIEGGRRLKVLLGHRATPFLHLGDECGMEFVLILFLISWQRGHIGRLGHGRRRSSGRCLGIRCGISPGCSSRLGLLARTHETHHLLKRDRLHARRVHDAHALSHALGRRRSLICTLRFCILGTLLGLGLGEIRHEGIQGIDLVGNISLLRPLSRTLGSDRGERLHLGGRLGLVVRLYLQLVILPRLQLLLHLLSRHLFLASLRRLLLRLFLLLSFANLFLLPVLLFLVLLLLLPLLPLLLLLLLLPLLLALLFLLGLCWRGFCGYRCRCSGRGGGGCTHRRFRLLLLFLIL
mmetsp:Transcript_133183/g.284736  ORF Transcript_133183/g.284736 Transcript_133183/m.284736 type:complete len:546 (+) Transcript_133183:1493-3130(+)